MKNIQPGGETTTNKIKVAEKGSQKALSLSKTVISLTERLTLGKLP